MSQSGDSTVGYTCPQCGAALSAQIGDAGRRRACPECGKQMKVPGQPSGNGGAAAGPATSGAPAEGATGFDHILVLCPCCGTRLYATHDQVGQQLVCPDCLESVAVTVSAKKSPPRSPAPKDPPIPSESGSLPPDSPADESPADGSPADERDELRLSEPVEVTHGQALPEGLASLLDESEDDSEESVRKAARAETRRRASDEAATKEEKTFAVSCPVCDSRVYATDAEIGTKKICPDCYTDVPIERPRPKPRRVSRVNEDEYAEDQYTLSEAEVPGVFKDQAASLTKKLSEDVLKEAEERADAEHRDPDVPDHPLWTGLFQFLLDPFALSRLLGAAVLLTVISQLALWIIELANGSGIGQFGAIFLLFIDFGLLSLAGPFIGTSCLAIIEDSSNGRDKITSWPEFNLFEWMSDCLVIVIAVFYSLTPGMVIAWVATLLGAPATMYAICGGLSFYALYPLVQLSLLESASMASPFSSVILRTLQEHGLMWITFYFITAGMGLLWAILVASTAADNRVMAIFLCVVTSVMMFMYFRLLGRVTWACRNEPPEKPTPSA